MYFRLPSKIRLNKKVKYKNTNVFYSHTDGGKTVVLLHGFLEDSSMWNGIAQRLEKRCSVIRIDLLGHGKTGCIGYVHSMEEQAEVVMCVLQKQNIKSCLVIGHSMGGYVALALAEKYPQVINGLVLFHSTALADLAEKKKDRQRAITIVERDKELFISAAIPILFKNDVKKRFHTEMKALIKAALQLPKQGIIANMRGMMERSDRTEVLRLGKFKKLLIHGAEDFFISTKSVQKQAELSSDIQLKILEGIGHMGHIETPEECEQIVAEFCGNTQTLNQHIPKVKLG